VAAPGRVVRRLEVRESKEVSRAVRLRPPALAVLTSPPERAPRETQESAAQSDATLDEPAQQPVPSGPQAPASQAETAPPVARGRSRSRGARRSAAPATRPRAGASRAFDSPGSPTPMPRSAAQTGWRAGSARRIRSPPFLFVHPGGQTGLVAGVHLEVHQGAIYCSWGLVILHGADDAGKLSLISDAGGGSSAA
jgi:hypothetical protein